MRFTLSLLMALCLFVVAITANQEEMEDGSLAVHSFQVRVVRAASKCEKCAKSCEKKCKKDNARKRPVCNNKGVCRCVFPGDRAYLKDDC